ncbi:MAG: MFS transporter, partial [Chloroflexota bacterium]|nr:MFS transporter [Chloroflexota bacterium]
MASHAQAISPPRVRRSSIASWVLYDLANTIFSLNITSLYFSLWVINEMGGTETLYARANAVATGLLLLAAPVLGSLSDQAPRRMPFLIVSTLTCVTSTLLLGVGGLLVSLVFFVVASFFYQAGLIFYDALLPEVSTEENRGRVGGLGVGIGYFGSIIGIGTGYLLLPEDPVAADYITVFRTTAVLFLIFAIPAFLFVRERPRRARRWGVDAVKNSLTETRQTLSRAGRYSGLRRFLLGRVFYAEAANTLILFMGVYVTNELGFSSGQAQLVLFIGIVAAIVGGLCSGVIVDRVGPKRSLDLVLLLWMVVLATAMAIPLLGLPSQLFWGVAAMAGVALGGTWGSDRPYMLRLSPPRYLGQFYGLYAMVGRFAAIFGPLLWGFIVDTLKLGRPAALAALLVLVLISFAILRG